MINTFAIQLLIVAARALGRLRAQDFAEVQEWVEAEAQNKGSGQMKMEAVLHKWNERFGASRRFHVARTVIEIAYAVLRARHSF